MGTGNAVEKGQRRGRASGGRGGGSQRQAGAGRTGGSGRQAKTRGVSLSPGEQALVDEFERLTGLGFTEQVRHGVLARLPAAVELLRDMSEAGMTPGKWPLTQQVLHAETDEEREALYRDDY